MANPVLTLKQIVPMNWTSAAQKSSGSTSQRHTRHERGRAPRWAWRTVIASVSWPNAAAVKKIEPTKNVTATTRASMCSK